MAWSNSKVFMPAIEDMFENTTAMDLNSDTFKAALFNNSITPSQTVASASAAYNADQWANTNELSDSTNWPAAGVALSGVASSFNSNIYTFDATDVTSPGAATLANVYGCLVYDDTLTTPVADQGLSYHYFGGANSVTAGTFSILWNASGLIQLTA